MITHSYDLVVIGSGPAGEKGAAQAAYFGKRVALVEQKSILGGAACTNGTLSSKTPVSQIRTEQRRTGVRSGSPAGIASYARLTTGSINPLVHTKEGGRTWRFAAFPFFRHAPAGVRSS